MALGNPKAIHVEVKCEEKKSVKNGKKEEGPKSKLDEST